MNGIERREKLLETLKTANRPVSGSELARQFGVSRQVIVQDIALLRTNQPILATAQGYLLYKSDHQKCRRAFTVSHTSEQVQDELNTIVDLGGKVLNVCVEHDVYGQITMDLMISNRQEVEQFCERLASSRSGPLLSVTGGLHVHTIEADWEDILDKIAVALAEKSYLHS